MNVVERHLLVNNPKTPYYVLKGRRGGPTILVTAGIHGTEIAGIIAATRLIHAHIESGTMIVVPTVNIRAFQQRKRGTPDLNRTFPRHAKGRARHRISQQLLSLVSEYRPRWCIDLHEANGFYRLNPRKLGQTIIVYPNKLAVPTVNRTIHAVNRTISDQKAKFSMRQGKLQGSFRTSVGQMFGIPAVTVETSMQQPLKIRVGHQLRIVRAICSEIGITW
ncbi:M99 family carboxypeptidase catalytic domain-containing protein [Alicyclobacillus dauci]|uniref:Succinylglutamate desuccinylase/aspartoacylase family protein n=1 Tax=Alicyclobacillus dauci TaxID=1475485 RepID=A0ABY6YYQ2_9BACL|nr:succinylglutamate desuccinylase/aspartoacylase family protein [Alicyclobacillus dauci]WAH35111.1 succinylglutamate desuccinylase/aspartoacylase family protein [Alicyclobacillus dauci]